MDFSWLLNEANLAALKALLDVYKVMFSIFLPIFAIGLLLAWIDRKLSPSSRSAPRTRSRSSWKSTNTLDKGKALELELVQLFRALGYQVQRTPLQGDWGVDLIIQDPQGKRIAIQAKNWSGKVGLESVYQVHGGKDIYKCHAARLIAPNGFTEQAERAARALGVELWSEQHLAALRQQVRRLQQQAQTRSQPTNLPRSHR
nr:MAG: hypothetical protein DIU70_08960 [Bacillota bacterium]